MNETKATIDNMKETIFQKGKHYVKETIKKAKFSNESKKD